MILPHTQLAVLFLMMLSALCWGCWTGALKMSGNMRFELFAFDLALGFMAFCLIYSLIFGNAGYDGFGLLDDALHAGKQQWAFGLAAGLVFALSNMFLLAAVSVGGMGVAFITAFGTAVVVQAGINLLDAGGMTVTKAIPMGGVLLALAAVVAAAAVHSSLTRQRHEALAIAGRAKSTRRPSGAKPIVLAIVSGILMEAWRPLVQKGMQGELGMGPYSMSVFLAIGTLCGTLAFGIFFIFLPVEGQPLDMSSLFTSTARQHVMGWLGGAILAAAIVGRLVALVANVSTDLGGALDPAISPVSPSLACILGHAGAAVAAVLGLLVWRELKDDAKGPARWMAVAMPLLFLGGLGLISFTATTPIIP